MIDWHSHILPQIDDGSRNVLESIELLKMLHQQNVDTVLATPHFYADNESVDSFLERRNNSFLKLESSNLPDSPQIILGAEVRYYNGISRLNEIGKLTVENNKILLLEMPMVKWTEYTVRELIELSSNTKIKIMLAHIDRYLKIQNNDVWGRLVQNGILIQLNASFFVDLISRRKALGMINDGVPFFIGSDCHGVKSRPPYIGKAFDIIRKKYGDDILQQINEYSRSVLVNNKY